MFVDDYWTMILGKKCEGGVGMEGSDKVGDYCLVIAEKFTLFFVFIGQLRKCLLRACFSVL